MKKLFHFVLSALLLSACYVYAEQENSVPEKPYYQYKQDGWFWYKDPPPVVKPTEKQKPIVEQAKPVEQAKEDNRRPELIEFEAMQKEVEDTRKIAIMHPTEENVKKFMRMHKLVSDKATDFTKTWQLAQWTDPTLTYGPDQARPINIAAMNVYDQELKMKRRAHIAKLSQTHGLFFFFRGDCNYCHALAPQLKAFSRDSGLTIFPVSLDGEGLAEYPNPAPDNGAAERMGITTVPALVLAVPSTGEKQIISFGVVTDTELYERIYKLTTQNSEGQQAQFKGE